MEKSDNFLGEKIASVRKSRKMSRAELSRIAKVPPSTIKGIEDGTSDEPSIKTILRVAEALNVNLLNLIEKDRETNHGSFSFAALVLDKLQNVSPSRRAVVLAVLFSDLSYVQDLSMDQKFARIAQELLKVP